MTKARGGVLGLGLLALLAWIVTTRAPRGPASALLDPPAAPASSLSSTKETVASPPDDRTRGEERPRRRPRGSPGEELHCELLEKRLALQRRIHVTQVTLLERVGDPDAQLKNELAGLAFHYRHLRRLESQVDPAEPPAVTPGLQAVMHELRDRVEQSRVEMAGSRASLEARWPGALQQVPAAPVPGAGQVRDAGQLVMISESDHRGNLEYHHRPGRLPTDP